MNVTKTLHDGVEFKSIKLVSKSKFCTLAVILAFELLFCQMLIAQPEYRLLFPKQDSIRFRRYSLYDNLSLSQLFDSETTFLTKPFDINYSNFQPMLNLAKNPHNAISFSQNKLIEDLPGLGSIKHFYNQIRWNAGSKIKLETSAGLAMQNTIMNLYVPNYQLTFRGAIEYSFNDWVTAYLYGQYLTVPLNKPDDFFDPFIYQNTLFLQNEVGAGIYTNYKKARIDLQIFSIYGSGYKDVRPAHSKIRIGF